MKPMHSEATLSVPEEHKHLQVYDRRDGGLCPVDPLYCSRFYDHACFNADSYASGYVVYGKPKPGVIDP